MTARAILTRTKSAIGAHIGAIGVGVGTGLLTAGVVGAVVASRKKRSSRSRRTRKTHSANRPRRKRRSTVKRYARSRSKRAGGPRVHTASNGTKYIKLANGQVRFIKKR